MNFPLEEAADALHTDKDNLITQGLMAYAREKLRELRAEIISLYLKYGVTSLEQLDTKINAGELDETATFDDFARLDYLESEVDKIRGLIKKLP